jgi:hypothetical protein
MKARPTRATRAPVNEEVALEAAPVNTPVEVALPVRVPFALFEPPAGAGAGVADACPASPLAWVPVAEPLAGDETPGAGPVEGAGAGVGVADRPGACSDVAFVAVAGAPGAWG